MFQKDWRSAKRGKSRPGALSSPGEQGSREGVESGSRPGFVGADS